MLWQRLEIHHSLTLKTYCIKNVFAYQVRTVQITQHVLNTLMQPTTKHVYVITEQSNYCVNPPKTGLAKCMKTC